MPSTCLTRTATAALATALAASARQGDVIGLSGPLGSGKTTFARYFIAARMGASPREQEVPSPTFTLVEIYQPASGPAIWHFDLYRIETPDDAYELGIEDAFADGIALIEWPERLGGLMPREHLHIGLAAGKSETARDHDAFAVARLDGTDRRAETWLSATRRSRRSSRLAAGPMPSARRLPAMLPSGAIAASRAAPPRRC